MISSKNATLKLNPEKCEPSQTKAIHLGHSASADGISDDGKEKKTQKNANLPGSQKSSGGEGALLVPAVPAEPSLLPWLFLLLMALSR